MIPLITVDYLRGPISFIFPMPSSSLSQFTT